MLSNWRSGDVVWSVERLKRITGRMRMCRTLQIDLGLYK
jgi:hypothetical protein